MKLEEILNDPEMCIKIANSRWQRLRHWKNIEKIIAAATQDPKWCYQAGLEWRDSIFNKYAEKIIAAMTKDPHLLLSRSPKWSCRAGRDWNDKRFNRAAEQIITAITTGFNGYENGDICYQAGREWNDERFDRYAQQIISAVSQDAQYSFEAGRDWDDERFNRGAEQIIAGVARKSLESVYAGQDWSDERFNKGAEQITASATNNGFCSHLAGREWNDERFNRFAEQIKEGIIKDLESCVEAGRNWSDERFNRVSKQIATALAQNPEWLIEALREWKQERLDDVSEQIISIILPTTYFCQVYESRLGNALKNLLETKYPDILGRSEQTRPEYKAKFWQFTVHIGSELMQKLPIEDFYSAAEAHQFSEQAHKEQEFYKELADNIEKGTTNRWVTNLTNYLHDVEPQYRTAFALFTGKLGSELVEKLPIQDFYNVAEAYEFAEQVKQEEPFFKGLKESIEKGTAGRWAKCIVKHFRDSSKGAGNYRLLEVAA